MRTIVLCGMAVAVASLPACTSLEPSERLMPRPAVAPTVGLILNEPEAFGGYTLINNTRSKTTYLMDDQGAVVHRWELGADDYFVRLLENGNLLVHGNRPEHVSEVDRHGNAVWKCTRALLHHDALKMPNGNILLLSRQRKTAAEAIAAGADPDFIDTDGLGVTHIIEVNPTGPANCEVVWEWSAWDHLIQDFDSSKANHGVVAEHPELIDINFRLSSTQSTDRNWAHSNGIDYNPELDQIILSPRYYSEVWIIDHSTTTAEAARR